MACRRWSSWLGAFLFSAVSPLVFAQTITLQGVSSNTCTYTSLTLGSDRNILVTCSGGSTDPAGSKGQIGFTSSAASRVETDSTLSVVVGRSGYVAGTASTAAASVRYTCTPSTGYTPTFPDDATGTLEFSGNQTKSFRITPTALPSGATSATVACSLSVLTNADPGPVQNFTLTVAKASQPGASCTSAPVKQILDPLAQGSTRATVIMGSGETVAVKLPGSYVRSGFTNYGIRLTTSMPITSAPPPTSYATEVFISECPGDFQTPPTRETTREHCGGFAEGVLSWSSKINSYPTPGRYDCETEASKTYYYNIRWRNKAGESTCSGSCGAFVDLSPF